VRILKPADRRTVGAKERNLWLLQRERRMVGADHLPSFGARRGMTCYTESQKCSCDEERDVLPYPRAWKILPPRPSQNHDHHGEASIDDRRGLPEAGAAEMIHYDHDRCVPEGAENGKCATGASGLQGVISPCGQSALHEGAKRGLSPYQRQLRSRAADVTPGDAGPRRGGRRSRHGLQDHDTKVLVGIVLTPVVGIRRPA
jgi:hypothetical protein